MSVGWAEITEAARAVAPLIGIGEAVLHTAAALMGWRAVAACIVLIDRRCQSTATDRILSARGYLRGCMEKARLDKLHPNTRVFGVLTKSAKRDEA